MSWLWDGLKNCDMNAICSSLPCNLDENILLASLPLLASEKVQGIEWSFDTLYDYEVIPDWFDELLKTFSDAGRLIGHGVFFSLFSGRWSPDQQHWLTQLESLAATYRFDHITEHFGFMSGTDFHKGAPLGVPLTPLTLAIGQDRLQRIQNAGNCPVGVENLAFAYSVEEVRRQGDFLARLVEPVNGFIILDLHNLYCQSHNFVIGGEELMRLYPLERVREIHISGGSWSPSVTNPARHIRRDTHDDSVPAEVFAWLGMAIDRCPNLKYVVLEQLGSGLATEADRRQFGNDFLQMDAIVQARHQRLPRSLVNSFGNLNFPLSRLEPLEDLRLYEQQRLLARILETAPSCQEALAELARSNLAYSAWQIEQWEPVMLETALAIAQKWQHGYA